MAIRYVSEGFAAGAVLIRQGGQADFTAGAELVLTAGSVFNAGLTSILGDDDAMLGNFALGEVGGLTFSAGAVIKKASTESSFVGSAIITTPTKERWLTADSIITTQTNVEFIITMEPNDEEMTVALGIFQPPANVASVVVSRLNVEGNQWMDVYSTVYANFVFTDYTPPLNVPFRYRFIAYNSSGQWVREGFTDDITIASESWTVSVQDKYNLLLDVVDAGMSNALQSEQFNTIGSKAKTVMAGLVLGHEGSITAVAAKQNRAYVLAVLERIVAETRQVYIRSPFGDIIPVVITNVSENFLVGGHTQVSFDYVQNGDE